MRQRPLTAIVGHEVRRAVYRGLDGEPKFEESDSALDAFVRAAGPHAAVCRRFGRTPVFGTGDHEPRPEDVEAVAVLLKWPADAADADETVDSSINEPPIKRPRGEA
eukprot:gnl/TRDRNA2_/TRDRNA2_167291_c0_seq3.p2 gnl/TRDRNA2_/TRDRNA2_167291_c0~~gnl/TRDRNA2_/TRDRNA2_167291_c0_seq3.p2  ORF type:complete len:107 (+),score=21.57 gnl/TRDRNA2_/TRDRNA2_167291_c0_seq3:331-651(+)